MKTDEHLEQVLRKVRACTACREHLPFAPRPVVAAGAKASIVIIGQAPGTAVHETGVPWNDPSGDHLREWLAVGRDEFYNTDRFALIPMGFCYPGRRSGGDAPPRVECAPLWHEFLFDALPRLQLLLLVGQYAQTYYLGRARKRTVTETVRAFREYLPLYFPLPHPSWRSRMWVRRNSWFEAEVLPELRARVRRPATVPN